jgi:dolichyl-phosphate-mannose-protein mannosyltransferase
VRGRTKHRAHPRKRMNARVPRLAAVVGLVLGAAGAAGLSLVSYATLHARVDRFAVEGEAGITSDEFDLVVLRLRLLAVALAAGAVVLLLFGGRVDELTGRVLSDWSDALRTAPRRGVALLRAQTVLFVVAAAAVFVVAAALRVAFLDVPLRYDEATTYVNFVSDPLYVSLSDYSTPNNHPLHTALAKVAVTIFGNSPTAIRLPALLAGLALVPAVLALGWMLYGRTAGLVAAAFTAVSSTLVEYATNARGYSLVALFTATGLLAAIRILSGGGAGAWAALVASGALGAFAVPVMLYAFGGILVWLAVSWLLTGRDRRELWRRLALCIGATGILTGLLYAPILVASGPTSLASNEFVESRTWSAFVDGVPDHLSDTARVWVRDLPAAAGILLGLVLLVSLVLTPRLSRFPFPPLAGLAAWAIPVVLAQRVVPYTRVWLFALPVAIVTAAGALAPLFDRARRIRGPELATALILAGGAALVLTEDTVRTSRETGALLDAEPVARVLAAMLRPGDTIVATGSDTILQYYLGRQGVDGAPLYDSDRGERVFVVVNTLGGQTLDDLLAESGLGADSEPTLLRSWPSAKLYVVRTGG